MNASQPLTPERLQRLTLVPDPTEELQSLLAGAAEAGDLSLLDFLTARDLLELSDCPQEPILALVLCMFQSLGEGSLCVRLDAGSLARRLGRWVTPESAQKWAARIRESLLPEPARHAQLSKLIGYTGRDCLPVVWRLADDGPRLFFQRHMQAGEAIRDLIQRRLSESAVAPDVHTLSRVFDEVSRRKPSVAGGKPMELHEKQAIAVVLSLLRPLAVISGGPGTGKTSVILTILRCLLRTGIAAERIGLAAPTGRAADRLNEAIETGAGSLASSAPGADDADAKLRSVQAATIHRLLRFNPSRDAFAYHAGNPLPLDAMIVDEVSMIDADLMAKLLEALPGSCKLVLVGDKNQLPSVDAGSVLADLVPGPDAEAYSEATEAAIEAVTGTRPVATARSVGWRDTVVLLTRNFRSEPHICEVADAVVSGRVEVIDALPTRIINPNESWPAVEGWKRFGDAPCGGCWRVRSKPSDDPDPSVIVDAWARSHYLADPAFGRLIRETSKLDPQEVEAGHPSVRELVAHAGRARILTLVHEGLAGERGINLRIAAEVRSHFDPAGASTIFAGAPIMITSNDYHLRLFNGNVGVVVGTHEGGYRVVFGRGRSFWSLPADQLPPFQIAYAVTVHKAQGSEFDQVLLVLPEDVDHPLLSRELLYTGITRAKRLAAIHGSSDALAAGITRRVDRDSGIDPWASGEPAVRNRQ